MIYIFLFFGNYASGKSFLARKITNNVVAYASPIRKIAFDLFKDEKFYSIQQEDKEAPFPVPKVIKKPKSMKQGFYDELMAVIDNFPQTYRGVLQAIGTVGRKISKTYWASLTKEKIQELIINGQEVICCDDLRMVSEYGMIKKMESSQITVIPVYISDGEELVGYDLVKLLKKADITVDNYRKKPLLKVTRGLITVEAPTTALRDTIIFLNSQEV